MITARTSNSEADERARRLVHVQDELRSALDKAPQIRQLFEQWIELRFSRKVEEQVCRSQ